VQCSELGYGRSIAPCIRDHRDSLRVCPPLFVCTSLSKRVTLSWDTFFLLEFDFNVALIVVVHGGVRLGMCVCPPFVLAVYRGRFPSFEKPVSDQMASDDEQASEQITDTSDKEQVSKQITYTDGDVLFHTWAGTDPLKNG